MFWWLYELLSSFKFLAVSGDERVTRSKRVYEFVLPIALTAAAALIYVFWPKVFIPTVLGKFAGSVFQLMIFVVPFHLAALAAFSAFSAEGLDEKLAGTNAQIRVWSNQDNNFFWKILTLRQYISLMFGYLCSIGIMYILIYLIISNLDLKYLLGKHYDLGHSLLLFGCVLFVLHYVILTIYAITFFFDKVNRVRSL
jgi:hypothetical protein